MAPAPHGCWFAPSFLSFQTADSSAIRHEIYSTRPWLWPGPRVFLLSVERPARKPRLRVPVRTSSAIALPRIFGADGIPIFALGEGVELSAKSEPAYRPWDDGRSLTTARSDC